MTKFVLLLVAMVVAMSACSGDDDNEKTPAADEETPVVEEETPTTEEETPTGSDSVAFIFERGTFADVSLPYRKAVIAESGEAKPILVVYLHGGTSKGNDNVKQLSEAGVDSITNYLSDRKTHAVIIVPQCPADKSWGETMTPVLKSLIDATVQNNSIETSRIYIMGGSMGGTGTWTMLSAYPGTFAAAMPVAGNPSKCLAANVATTPVYTVMGTADRIMSTTTVETFLERITSLGGDTMYDLVTGWTHEDTCIRSYTSDRLEWVFSHSR